jgi:hypothetical protein
MSEQLDAFLEDVSVGMDYWTEYARRGLTDPNIDEVRLSDDAVAFRRASRILVECDDPGALDAFVGVVRSCVQGALHGAMVVIDNGTKMAETTPVALVSAATGEPLSRSGAYHELLVDYMYKTGRLK